MAYYLCSSLSSLYHDRHPLCNSTSSPPNIRLRRRTTFRFTFDPLSPPRLATFLRLIHVSLQDPILQEESLKNPNPSTQLEPPDLNAKSSSSSSKRYVWVNPKSSRGSQLRQRSYDSRYASLVKVAEALNSCNPTEDDVFRVLTAGLGDTTSLLVEQDAVLVLNNMMNPETAPLALSFFQQKLHLTKEVILYNVTLKVFRKSKKLVMAEKLFDQMLERGLQPDNITFSTIISCARQCSLPNKAVEWFEKMPTYGCNPDEVTYSVMIDAYGRAGNIDMALSLYDRARTEKWRIDAVTFSTVIKIYGTSGNYDGSLNVYEEMKALGVKPNTVVYNTLLDAMGRARRPSQAKSIFKEMTSNGLLPTRATYVALIRAYGRARYGEDAIGVYKEMKEKGFELNVVLYNTLLSMCADMGYVDEAFEIFEDMKFCTTVNPDSWTYSSMVTIYSCSGKVLEAEGMLNEMLEAGFEPNIFVLTSLIQCYGKANHIDDVVKTLDKLIALGINPDDRFCGCLLSVMTQTPKDELWKLTACIEKANGKLGLVVKLLLDENVEGIFEEAACHLFDSVSGDVKKAYCNCLIDLCVNLNLFERASEVLELGLTLKIYTNIQSRTPARWSLHLRSLSLGAARTALYVWMNDLSKALDNGEELPSVLGINTGHGRHKYSDKGLAGVFESHLKELNAPFHEAPDMVGWFLTTRDAAAPWLESRKSHVLVTA